ncbi:MAG: hypothetical protein SPD95_00625 [Candidatus Faecousia sp.]|nr:hypothetical protein [Candidatus Faecousia sp.]
MYQSKTDARAADAEIIGLLMAISTVSKRLAHKMIRVTQASQSQEGGKRYEQNERDGCHHQRTAEHCCFY